MAQVTLKGSTVSTVGDLPAVGVEAPSFTLVGTDLGEVSLSDFAGKKVVLNIFPSIDTSVCAASVKRFDEEASSLEGTVVLCISMDLPFAQDRFCGAEGLGNVKTLSAFRDHAFGKEYGLLMADGPIAGLLARAVLVIDEQGVVTYTELVPEITQEPNYASALEAVQ